MYTILLNVYCINVYNTCKCMLHKCIQYICYRNVYHICIYVCYMYNVYNIQVWIENLEQRGVVGVNSLYSVIRVG